MLTDPRGVAMTGSDPRLVPLYEQALDEALCFFGDPIASIDAALALDPSFVMGHCFRAQLLLLTMERQHLPEVRASLRRAEALAERATARERGHIAAVQAGLTGNLIGAGRAWEQVLLDQPTDLLALLSGHMTDFYLGESAQMRDRMARALPAWDEAMPGYGYVLGMYAFGLEECADYARAEALARDAVARNTRDIYAIHAVAHVHEMEGRQADGIAWLRGLEGSWGADNGMSIHLWWHLSLLHLDIGDFARVLAIYDNEIRKPSSDISLEELDAAALLWRLQLMDIDVGGRWQDLAEKWEPSAEDTHYAFNDMHAMMTFAAGGRTMAAAKLLGAAASYVTERGGTNAIMTREVGIPVCRAFLAFANGDYDAVIDLLLPIRYTASTFGGSYAQRDVIALTLIEAALRGGRPTLARALLAERTALKPASPINWHLTARAHEGLDDGQAAAAAAAEAERLRAIAREALAAA